MKGPEAGEEVKAAAHALECLQAKVEEERSFLLSDDSRRTLVRIRKTGTTPLKYPRPGAKMAKNPL